MDGLGKLGNIKAVQPFVVFVLVAVAFGGGFYLGKVQGTVEVQREAEELMRIVETVYPPPPEEMHRISGKITECYGASFTVEFDDPSDYLPRLDGSPRRKIVRGVTVNAATEIKLVDYVNLDEYGSPAISGADASAIEIGVSVRVETDDNVRDAEEFIASSVEVVRQ